MRPWALVTLGALALAGCGDAAQLALENQRLRQELQKASTALDERWAERQADLAYWRREATIAAACDYLIPLCPGFMTAPGREAIANGAYGGGGGAFWGLVAAKLAALGAAAAGFWLALHLGGLRLMRPAQADIAQARAMIADAEAKADAARAQAREAERRFDERQEAIAQAEQTLEDALEAVRIAQEAGRKEQANLDTLRQLREALAGL